MIPTKNGWFHTKHDHVGYFYHWNQLPLTELLGHWGMVPSCGMVKIHVQSCIHIGYGHRSHTRNPNIVDIMVMTVIPSGFPLNDHSLHPWHNSISFPWHSWTVHGVCISHHHNNESWSTVVMIPSEWEKVNKVNPGTPDRFWWAV